MRYLFGTLELDCGTRELFRDGAPTRIEPKVFDLLQFLIERRDRVVTKEELIEEVWDARFISDAALSSAISSARKAIGDGGRTQKYIRTVHGRGFRFHADDLSQSVETAAQNTELPRGNIAQLPSIAVLPFTNLSGDASKDYFVDGVCEDLITALSKIGWLVVISRGSTIQYRDTNLDISEVATELGARYILAGRVQMAGDRIRATVHLMSGETANEIWTERFDRKLEDVFAVQDEIAESVVGALEPQVSLAENRNALSKPKQQFDAWDCVVRAMALKSAFDESSSREALELLDQAIEIDPEYGRAYSQKAWTIVWRIHQGWEDTDKALARAIEAAELAVKFDPREPWAYIAWLFIATILRDPVMLLESPRRALEINPNFAMAHSWMGASLALTGDGASAFQWIDRARQLSPRDMFKEEFDVHTSYAYFQIGDYENAYLSAHKAMLPHPHHVYPRLMMTAALAQQGNVAAAKLQTQKILKLVPDFSLEAANRACVFVRKDEIGRFVDGLRMAGLT